MSATRTAEREPTQTPRATYQDVLDAPAHRVAEIVDGTLYTHPRPAPLHAVASSRLGFDLGGPFDRGRGGPGGWWIIDEPARSARKAPRLRPRRGRTPVARGPGGPHLGGVRAA